MMRVFQFFSETDARECASEFEKAGWSVSCFHASDDKWIVEAWHPTRAPIKSEI
jgi:hypothetical protein